MCVCCTYLNGDNSWLFHLAFQGEHRISAENLRPYLDWLIFGGRTTWQHPAKHGEMRKSNGKPMEIQWFKTNLTNLTNLLVDLVAPGGLRTLRNHMAMAQISWHPKKSLDCVRIFNTIDITRVVPVLTSTFSPVLRFKLTGGPHPNSWSTLLARHQGPSGRRHRTARGQHVMKHDET